MRNRALGALVLCLASAPLAANTYTVTSTADAGAGTLRQAILDANANPGADSIAFAIVGSGVQKIAPLTILPNISESVTIDGYTQPGSSPNTNAPDQGSNAVLLIDISGESLPAANTSDCLRVTAPDVTVRGLVLRACFDDGIEIRDNADRAIVAGNFIGVDPSGAAWGGQQGTGVLATGVDDVLIGGLSPADRNVIAGNSQRQIDITGPGGRVQGNLVGLNAAGTGRLPGFDEGTRHIDGGPGTVIGGTTAAARNVISSATASAIFPAANNVIQGNFIGTDVTGTQPVGNYVGLQINSDGVIVGGSAPGAGNVIAASAGGVDGGISFLGGDNCVVQGNFIGTDVTGTRDLGNVPYGIVLRGTNNTIGGIGPGEGNVIAFNGGGSSYRTGVYVDEGSGHRIRGNRIYQNKVFGIDIQVGPFVGPAPIDDLDADTGPNGAQNFPIVSSVDYGATTTVHGTLDSAASTIFDVDFYASPACQGRPVLYLQGQEYVGSTQVTTDGAGHAEFDFVLPEVLAAGQPVTAIATDPAGNSSEFSSDLLFVKTDLTGPAEGGTNNNLFGQFFEPGATVLVGGVPSTSVVVVDSNNIDAAMPALPAGSVNDITVQNPGGSSGTRPNAWIAFFNDRGTSGTFANDVDKLVANEITVGVGGGNYGYAENIKRQSMAVFILKAKHGICYTPPPCVGLFSDVPCSSPFAPWIEAMANEGITGGCGGGLFCPQNPVRRDQMAVFLTKADRGSSFTPPPCTGRFADVACPSTFANWIEQLAADGITTGCGGGNYCPTNNNTRGQMATFVVKAFGLQAP